jgi:glycosyltransferase involved in cell wall biosynthesis
VGEAPIRILFLARGYWPMLGGGERLAAEVSEGLARRGHRVRVLLLEGGAGAPAVRRPDDFPPMEGRHGVELLRAPDWGRWERRVERIRRSWLPARGELRQWVRRFERRALLALVREHAADADLLLLSNADPLSLAAPEALGSPPRAALLYITQSHLTDPRWPHAQVAACWAHADALAVNTPFEAAELARRYAVDPAACVVTGCGTHPPPSAAPWTREPVVLFLGRLGVEKRIDFLLAAMRRVWERRSDARLVVAGARVPGTERVDACIAALPADLRAKVALEHDVSEERKQSLLARAHVLALPSVFESFGIVLTEAWGHGTPVVAMDTGVARDVVRHDVDGLLADLDDPDALARALLLLLDDEALARRLGAAGREAVLARWTWDHVAARYEQAARLALARHAARREALTGAVVFNAASRA